MHFEEESKAPSWHQREIWWQALFSKEKRFISSYICGLFLSIGFVLWKNMSHALNPFRNDCICEKLNS